MQEVKLWENNKYVVLQNIQEVVEAIKIGALSIIFDIKHKFVPGDDITTIYDSNANKNNYTIIYTDSEHPVITSKYQTFINPTFFKENKEEMQNAYIEYIKNSDITIFSISKNMFSDAILDELLKIKDVCIYLYDINLSDEQIQKINDRDIDCYCKNNKELVKINSRYAFSIYTKTYLQEQDTINIYYNDILNGDIKNLKYLKENAVINIHIHIEEYLSEEEKLSILKDKLLELDSIGKKYVVKFRIDKRSIFNTIFKDIKFNNLNLIIDNDYYDYPYLEYLEEEKKLDDLVKDIKNKNLSPLEKYIFVYNIVKNFKPYKENNEDKDQARNIRYILNNDFIVCVGYAKLLVTLLDKVGIDATELSVEVDISYDDGFTLEEKTALLAGHQRVIVSIDDPKYNIHGLYISDPTWDNDLSKNYLNNSLLTFDSMQVDKRMFEFNFYNPILDIHNFQEYNNQINLLLNRELKQNKDLFSNYPFSKQLCLSYNILGKNILKAIECDPKYFEFLKILKDCKTENDYINFYTKLGYYLLTRINIPIDENILFEAHKEVLRQIPPKQPLSVEQINESTKNNYYEKDMIQFPYKIPDNSDFYLEDRAPKK